MQEGIRYRPPRWWTAAALALLLGGVLGALAGASLLFLVVTVGFGSLTLFVAHRSWAQLSAAGVELCPNGARVIRAEWDEVLGVVGRRILLADGRRVTVPPLAGDPLAHVRAEVEHRARSRGAS